MKKLINLLKALNILPIFHISDDNNFGTIDRKANRLSLIHLILGRSKLYFISFDLSKNKFSLFFKLEFDNLVKIVDQSKITEESNSYKALINNKNEDEKNNNIDFLKYKIDKCQSISSSSLSKANSYSAALFFYSGFMLYLLNEILTLSKSGSGQAILPLASFILSGYFAVNCFLFIRLSLKIKAYSESSFRDLKENPSLTQLSVSYYMDWRSARNASNRITSITLNIEDLMTKTLVFSVLTFILITLPINYTSNSIKGISDEYILLDSSGIFQKDELVRLLSNQRKSNEIHIIGNSNNNAIVDIKKIMDTVENKNLKIDIISLKTNLLDGKTIVIKETP